MPSRKPLSPTRRTWLLAGASAAAALAVPACKAPPPGDGATGKPPAPPAPGVLGPVPAEKGSPRASAAATPRAYREDAATHLYGLNAPRIFKGKLPPLLYAVGVLQVDIDHVGRVTRVGWMRAPRHAPEVMAEIERTVHAASPFPAPTRLGRVTYTDTWLWHKSGKFQLDTLTEGQL
jgi:periplasmic protein TonB